MCVSKLGGPLGGKPQERKRISLDWLGQYAQYIVTGRCEIRWVRLLLQSPRNGCHPVAKVHLNYTTPRGSNRPSGFFGSCNDGNPSSFLPSFLLRRLPAVCIEIQAGPFRSQVRLVRMRRSGPPDSRTAAKAAQLELVPS